MEKAQKTSKFDLDPVELVSNKGFKASELREIRMLIQQNINPLVERWDEHFN